MLATMASSLGTKASCSSFDVVDRSLPSRNVVAARRMVPIKAQQQEQQQQQIWSEQSSSRRTAMFGLLAAAGLAAVDAAKATTSIKVFGPPPPSGGLPGTENSDQPRDLDLPLKERFYLQPVQPSEAVLRVKDAAKDIVGVKELIDKKSWPYVRNDLRNKATYLRYDLQTIVSSKTKAEGREIKKLSKKLFETMDSLDYAAREKDSAAAEKSYKATVAALNDVIAKLS